MWPTCSTTCCFYSYSVASVPLELSPARDSSRVTFKCSETFLPYGLHIICEGVFWTTSSYSAPFRFPSLTARDTTFPKTKPVNLGADVFIFLRNIWLCHGCICVPHFCFAPRLSEAFQLVTAPNWQTIYTLYVLKRPCWRFVEKLSDCSWASLSGAGRKQSI